MAELERIIKVEQSAREKLAKQYEASMNNGLKQMNQQTEILSDNNPLVDKISLIVAQQLLEKTSGNEPLTELIRQGSVNGEVLH